MGYGKNPPEGGRDKRKSKGAGKVPFADIRFVRIELLESERQEFRAQLASGEFDDISIDDFLDSGYKITFSNDPRGAGVICSATALQGDHPNAGLVLTGRGRDSATALAVVSFKDSVLCPDGLWRAAEDRRGGSYSDVG